MPQFYPVRQELAVEPGPTPNDLGDAGYIQQPVSIRAVFLFRIVILTETEPAWWYQRQERKSA